MKKWFLSTMIGLGTLALLSPKVAFGVGATDIPMKWFFFSPATSWQNALGAILQGLILVLGAIAAVFFVYGGITYLTAAGNEEQVKKGRTILLQAVIGLILITLAFVLVRTIGTGIFSQSVNTQ